MNKEQAIQELIKSAEFGIKWHNDHLKGLKLSLDDKTSEIAYHEKELFKEKVKLEQFKK